ncbi:hypothetical protein ACS0TY_009727 [Phlomoides rotata]
MDVNGTVGGADGEKGKATRGRRTWSKMEEDYLIQCLNEIVNDGWKADNGFKAGFQRELEKGLRKLMPGTDILANPHINSKIHVWKKEYGMLSDLLSKSGIGWDSSTNTIDVVDEAVWDAHKRADPGVKTMRYKSWPYYDHWVNIFGKDRATGEHAVDAMDFVNELLRGARDDLAFTGTKGNTYAGNTEQVAENGSINVPSDSGVITSKGKKRKVEMNEIGALVDTLGSFMNKTDDSFVSLSNRIAPEHDVKMARTNLIAIMNKIPGISLHNKLKVSDELVQNDARMDLFLNLPENEQTEYVHMLLSGELGSS